MKALVTGAAGFIGSHLAEAMASAGWSVTGVDNLNDYYDPRFKIARLERCGFDFSDIVARETATPRSGSSLDEVAFPAIPRDVTFSSSRHPELRFIRADIRSMPEMERLFASGSFDVVVNLAAQAGARHSLSDPYACFQSNVTGFLNLLECARRYPVGRFIYASSSSVYGLNGKSPFSEHDNVDSPVSVYAVSKRSNELLAHVYALQYGIPVVGLRFFTVYGPWGRPDMAPMLFASAIRDGRPLRIFNHGGMTRDFTYIDDVVEAMMRIASADPRTPLRHNIYNVGCGHPVCLTDFVNMLEENLSCSAPREYLPMQPGDVPSNFADTSLLRHDFGFAPSTSLDEGIRRFVAWFQSPQNPL